jgi:hypothetical protein
MVVGTLVLFLAGPAGMLARAQVVEQAGELAAGHFDLQRQAELASDASGEKADCVAECSPCPSVYAYGGILFLERSNGGSDQRMIVDRRGPDDTVLSLSDAAPVLSTSDLDFDFDPALRVALGHRLHNGWVIEGAYLGLCDADTSAFISVGESPILTFPGGLGPGSNVFRDMNRIWVDYSSGLHSGELNLLCCCGCCSTCGKSNGACGGCNMYCRTYEWFLGFRYLNLREHLNIYAERDQDPTVPASPVEPGVYDIRTSNNLYGLQVGARARRWGKRLGWEAAGKAGMFGNDVQQEQYVNDFASGGSFPRRPLTSAADDKVAFVGELDFTGIYRLTDVWNLRAGYNLIWIAGVALAPDQLDFRGTLPAGDQLSGGGSVFLHGVSCGAEARW